MRPTHEMPQRRKSARWLYCFSCPLSHFTLIWPSPSTTVPSSSEFLRETRRPTGHVERPGVTGSAHRTIIRRDTCETNRPILVLRRLAPSIKQMTAPTNDAIGVPHRVFLPVTVLLARARPFKRLFVQFVMQYGGLSRIELGHWTPRRIGARAFAERIKSLGIGRVCRFGYALNHRVSH